MIRVLQVVTSMNRGGLETMIMNYYRQIDKSKIQFDFLEHRDFESDYTKEILEMGGCIYKVPRQNPFSKNYKKALDQFFLEHPKYQIVHSHIDCMSADPLAAAKRAGVPVRIAHSHNSNQARDLKYPLKMICKKGIPAQATDLLACGREAGEFMYDGAPFTIMNNAIDTAKYAFSEEVRNAKRVELGLPEDAIVIGHVGRFDVQKNHKFLLSNFNEIVKMNEKAVLLLVGTGVLEENVKKQAEELGLTKDVNIMFLGSRNDVPELMQAMDLFLFPSLFEGLPLTLVEAQAAGLPVVMSDVITKDCVLTDYVKTMSLQQSPEVWAEETLRLLAMFGKSEFSEKRTEAEIQRTDLRSAARQQVVDGGFDIVQNAKWLEDFYLSKIEELN